MPRATSTAASSSTIRWSGVILFLVLAWLCAAGTSHGSTAATATRTTAAAPAILVLGDSLSAAYGIRADQGWVALLQSRLRAKGYGHRVINASSTGETTGGALARLPRALASHRPAIVVVELGGNDGLRGLPVADVRRNLESIVRLSREAGAKVLLLGMRVPPNYGAAYTQQFDRLFPALARELGLPYVPFLLGEVALDDGLMQEDGIHPTAAAQPKLLAEVWPKLEPLLGKPCTAAQEARGCADLAQGMPH